MNITPIAIAAGIAIVLFGIIGILLDKLETSTLARRYKKIPFLLTPAEGYFLRELAKAMPDDLLVFTKVRLCDVVEVKTQASKSMFYRAFNRIAKKHLDFVLCRESDFSIVGAIELDDRTHNRAKRIARDQFVDEVMEKCAVPLHRVKVQPFYNQQELKKVISAMVETPVAPASMEKTVK